jgi:DNA-binding LytR/AlgR family response regulator
MLTIAICEDEPHMMEELERAVTGYLDLCGISGSVTAYRRSEPLLFSGVDYDVILMDIRLPGKSGMDAAQELRRRGKVSQIVFITSSREDVFAAFDVDAAHFLVKPVSEEALYRALDKACSRLETGQACLTIKTGIAVKKIPIRDIVYCEVSGHKVTVVPCEGEKMVYYNKLADLIGELGEGFFHCHRSYLINLAHVLSYEGDDSVHMEGGHIVPVSRRCKTELSGRLLSFLRKEMLG